MQVATYRYVYFLCIWIEIAHLYRGANISQAVAGLVRTGDASNSLLQRGHEATHLVAASMSATLNAKDSNAVSRMVKGLCTWMLLGPVPVLVIRSGFTKMLTPIAHNTRSRPADSCGAYLAVLDNPYRVHLRLFVDLVGLMCRVSRTLHVGLWEFDRCLIYACCSKRQLGARKQEQPTHQG